MKNWLNKPLLYEILGLMLLFLSLFLALIFIPHDSSFSFAFIGVVCVICILLAFFRLVAIAKIVLPACLVTTALVFYLKLPVSLTLVSMVLLSVILTLLFKATGVLIKEKD